MRFLTHLLDTPIWLGGIKALNAEGAGEKITYEWVRTQADTSVPQLIPDAQLRVRFPSENQQDRLYTLVCSSRLNSVFF